MDSVYIDRHVQDQHRPCDESHGGHPRRRVAAQAGRRLKPPAVGDGPPGLGARKPGQNAGLAVVAAIGPSNSPVARPKLSGAEYPPAEEVRKAWADVSSELPKSLASASPELLEKPHDKPTFDGKLGGFIAFLAFHETYHVGQVGYLRKWLGFGSLVG